MNPLPRRLALACFFLLFTFANLRLSAAPPLSTIQDTLYRADGTPYTGYLIIEWKSFEASDNSTVASQSLQLRIYNGQLRTRLVPTTTATPGAYYRVRYVSDGKVQFTENWAVPPTNGSLAIRQVRTNTAPPGGNNGGGGAGAAGSIEIADVNGLPEELDLRPRKGLAFLGGRAAVINGLGEVEGASGSPDDCVHVDGTSGPCGSGGGPAPAFVDGETPTGAINGVNPTFTLSQAPNPAGSLLVYRNGLLQRPATDFTLSGSTVTFTAGSLPQTGDLLAASYRLSGSGAAAAQVLCASTGAVTSATTSTSLGTCTLPANLLRAGDRVDIRFDYTHQGSTSGFSYEVRWGATTLVSRTAAAAETRVTGRTSSGIRTAAQDWSAESWGTSLAFTAGAGSATENFDAPITVDLRGQLSAAGTDALTVSNFTIVRYPAP